MGNREYLPTLKVGDNFPIKDRNVCVITTVLCAISASCLCVIFDLRLFYSRWLSHLQGASWQLFFCIKHLSNEQYGGRTVHIMKLGFYLGHLEGHLLAITPQDVSQQTQGPLPGNDVLLLHFCPHRICLFPVVCLL